MSSLLCRSTNDENVCLANRRITIREVADDIGSFAAFQAILTDVLGNFDQNNCRLSFALELLNDDPDLLKRAITGDETWIYVYDVKTKAQSSQWKHSGLPRPKKSSCFLPHRKTVFFFLSFSWSTAEQRPLPRPSTNFCPVLLKTIVFLRIFWYRPTIFSAVFLDSFLFL